MNEILDILWEAWFRFPHKQKAVAVILLLIGGISTLIPFQGIHDITILVMFCLPISLYLFFSRRIWID